MLRSGRSASLGGGGLGGALAYLAGISISGRMTSSLEMAGEFGLDMDFWIAWRGSWMMWDLEEKGE
jgi:hypothetical protein